MPAKKTRPVNAEAESTENKAPAKPKTPSPSARARADGTQAELMQMALKACLIARDATFNVQDLLTTLPAWPFSPSATV